MGERRITSHLLTPYESRCYATHQYIGQLSKDLTARFTLRSTFVLNIDRCFRYSHYFLQTFDRLPAKVIRSYAVGTFIIFFSASVRLPEAFNFLMRKGQVYATYLFMSYIVQPALYTWLTTALSTNNIYCKTDCFTAILYYICFPLTGVTTFALPLLGYLRLH